MAKEETKRCTKCGEVKALSEFHKSKNQKDGLDVWCKTCKRAANKRRRDANRESEIKKCQRYDRCVKNPSCPAVGGYGAKFVLLTCPVCGVEYRKRKSVVDYQYEHSGQTAFYCSGECFYKSRRKSHQTKYAENIKRIRKEQKI